MSLSTKIPLHRDAKRFKPCFGELIDRSDTDAGDFEIFRMPHDSWMTDANSDNGTGTEAESEKITGTEARLGGLINRSVTDAGDFENLRVPHNPSMPVAGTLEWTKTTSLTDDRWQTAYSSVEFLNSSEGLARFNYCLLAFTPASNSSNIQKLEIELGSEYDGLQRICFGLLAFEPVFDFRVPKSVIYRTRAGTEFGLEGPKIEKTQYQKRKFEEDHGCLYVKAQEPSYADLVKHNIFLRSNVYPSSVYSKIFVARKCAKLAVPYRDAKETDENCCARVTKKLMRILEKYERLRGLKKLAPKHFAEFFAKWSYSAANSTNKSAENTSMEEPISNQEDPRKDGDLVLPSATPIFHSDSSNKLSIVKKRLIQKHVKRSGLRKINCFANISKSGRNMTRMKRLAQTALRYHLDSTVAAACGTATLEDYGTVTKKDKRAAIDRQKVITNMNETRDAMYHKGV